MNRPMLGAPEDLPDEHTQMHCDFEGAKIPKASLVADIRSGVMPRDPKGREGDRGPEGLILSAPNRNIRRRSSLALAEIEMKARRVTVPLTGSEELRKCPASWH